MFVSFDRRVLMTSFVMWMAFQFCTVHAQTAEMEEMAN